MLTELSDICASARRTADWQAADRPDLVTSQDLGRIARRDRDHNHRWQRYWPRCSLRSPTRPAVWASSQFAFPYLPACLAGLMICIAGYFGDLNISGIKRDIGVKDSGHMLPGQGGILDRIDSLMFTAPLFYYFVRYAVAFSSGSGEIGA